ncbi:MAG: M2 family metallopeptidase, partial [Xanthomonadales bacterium]|nr:M2 family metallopeptidase [Xanthomonadales bacterium]
MNLTRTLLAGAVALGLAACQNQPAQPAADSAKPDAAGADKFVADINAKIKKDYPEITAAQWLSVTYINGDTQLLAAKSNEKFLGELKANVDKSVQFNGVELKPDTRRAIDLLKLSTAMPAPKDPTKLGELTAIATKMEGMYGAGKYCRDGESGDQCRDLVVLSEVLAKSRDYDAQLDAWNGWHTISKPMRADYQRFAGLI